MSVAGLLGGAAALVGVGAYSLGSSNATVLQTAPTIKDDKDFYAEYHGTDHTINSSSQVHKINLAKKGLGAVTPVTVMDIVRRTVKHNGDKVFLRAEENLPPFKQGIKPPESRPLDQWRSWTFKEFYEEVRVTARAFIALGMESRAGVAIWGFNAAPWHISMIAATFGGGITSGIYATDTPDQVKYKMQYTNCNISVVETVAHAKKILSIASELQFLKAIVIWAPEGPLPSHESIKVVNWKDIETVADKVPESELVKREEAQEAGSVFVYTFTSGTTGLPKAAIMTHDNLIYTAIAMRDATLDNGNSGLFVSGEERIISYLPLSHIAGSVLDIVCPILCSSMSSESWVSVSFARPYDLKASTIVERFQAVKPTVFFGVPRVWEKIAEKMQAKVAANPITGVKLTVAKWALGVSMDHQLQCQLGGSGRKGWGYSVAKKIILDKVRQALGLTECKYFVSAAAPLSVEVMEYFGARGIHINEAYGMTESGGGTVLSTDQAHVWGAVGFPLEGTEACVMDDTGERKPFASNLVSPEDNAQGEICFRGRGVTAGYLANPELGEEHVKTMIKKTQEAIDKDGWLHTGDMGVQTKEGMFKITGRYKELIIGAGGENIAPVPIENEIKRLCPAVSNVMMVGDKRKFNVAMVTLKVVGATGEVAGTNELELVARNCASAGITTVEGACKDEKLIAAITQVIKTTNANGAVTPSNAAKIQKFTILPTEFSVEGGELTPTLKLKRHVVQKMYTEHLDAMYESKDLYVPFPQSRL